VERAAATKTPLSGMAENYSVALKLTGAPNKRPLQTQQCKNGGKNETFHIGNNRTVMIPPSVVFSYNLGTMNFSFEMETAAQGYLKIESANQKLLLLHANLCWHKTEN